MAVAATALTGCNGCNRKQDGDSAPEQGAAESDPTRAIADRGAAKGGRPFSLPSELGDTSISAVQAKFIAFGDSGVGNQNQVDVAASMSKLCKHEGCDFAIHTGDIVYPSGIQSPSDPLLAERFEKPYAKLRVPIFLSLGNHDHYGNPDAWVEAYKDGAGTKRGSRVEAHMPARYYTFVRGGVRFVALDTSAPTEAQAQWAWRVLRNSRAEREPWVIAFGHHPRRSHGAHGDAQPRLARWLDHLLCHHVDIYVAGHDHDKQVLASHCGVHQVVTGAAAQLREKGEGAHTVFADDTLGFTYFVARGDSMRMTMHDVDGKEQFRRTYRRSRPVPVCGKDQTCNGMCGDDPDCKTIKCGKDRRCNPACTDDPDCVFGANDAAGCPCDRHTLVCEVRSSRSDRICACDPSCQAGWPTCIGDGFCDAGCKKGSDPDCQ